MAPPTLPTEVKRRRGTLRKDRTPVALATAPPITRVDPNLPPPPTLKEAGAAEWRHALLVCSWIGASDLLALRCLCEAVDRREMFMRVIEKASANIMLQTAGGFEYTNPAVNSLEKTEDRITKWMQQLGMTPSARSALGVAEVKQASTLDRLAADRAARRSGPQGSTPQSPTSPSSTGTARRSSPSSTTTGGSPRTASPAPRATPSTHATGSDG